MSFKNCFSNLDQLHELSINLRKAMFLNAMYFFKYYTLIMFLLHNYLTLSLPVVKLISGFGYITVLNIYIYLFIKVT